MKHVLLLLLLSTTAPAFGGWWPVFSPNRVRVAVGEAATVEVSTHWSGLCCYTEQIDWRFSSAAPHVATASVRVKEIGTTPFEVTGIAPGRTEIPGPYRDWVSITVYCAPEPAVDATMPVVPAHIGESVDLVAASPIAHRSVFAWYAGRIGDVSHPLAAAGPVLTFTPAARGTQYVWVQATTPCSTSNAEFRIEANIPKRRAVRK